MTKTHVLTILSILGLTIFLNIFGLLQFESWSQVEDLYEYNSSLSALVDHPHFYRYIIALPGLILKHEYVEIGFSIYISIFMLSSMLLMYLSSKRSLGFVIVLSCSIMFFIHLFMNGRGAISWLGWMIILNIISKEDQNITFFVFLKFMFALLCCSVSSGTFTIAFSTVIFYIFKIIFDTKSVKTAIFLGAIFIIYKNIAAEGIERNLSYYSLGTDNPLFNMIEHGFGTIFREYAFLIISLLSLIVILSTFIVFSLRRKIRYWELICVSFPLAGGVFGYTTLTLAIPSIILILSARAERQERHVRFQSFGTK
jgi:hypothetical protein